MTKNIKLHSRLLLSRSSAVLFIASAALSASVNAIAQESDTKTYIKPDSITARLLEENNTGHFILTPYESNYLIHTYTSNMNRSSISSYSWSEHARKDESKFQISLGFPVYRGIFGENSLLGASYTQRSWWQSLNAAQSSPFRETNYEPQLFVGFVTDYRLFGWTVKDIEFGFNHQSNGRPKETSRSWNRLYARAMATNDNVSLGLKVWYRIPENAKNDDNPQMTSYMGYYQLSLGYTFDKHVFSAQTHYNWNSGYGNIELGWSYPLTDTIRIYSQLFTGYGESMIDYDYKQTRFGIGVMLNDLF